MKVYGESCLDVKNAYKWCREFAAGRTEIHVEERRRRPSTSDEPVAAVEKTLRESRQISLDNLHILVPEVFPSTIHKVLCKKGQYWKMGAGWIPRMLTEHHKR